MSVRILFLTSQLPYAGIAGGHSLVYERMLRLGSRGHEVGLASFCDETGRAHVGEIKNRLFELELLPMPQEPSLPNKFVQAYLGGIPLPFQHPRSREMRKLVGTMVDRSRYDVVLAEFSVMGQYLFRNPWLNAVRRVISCHHSPAIMAAHQLKLLGGSLLGLKKLIKMYGLIDYECRLYRSADRVLTLSREERYALLNLDPTLRISVVPNGVDANFYHPPSDAPREQAIIFTGNYLDPANEDAIISFTQDVWPRLRRSQPGLKFYIVGPSPPVYVRAQAARDNRLVVTGRVDDIRSWLHKAQVFVCPVRMGRGMRGKILEAMASGLPVVSTSLGVEGLSAQMGDNCFIADTPKIMRHYIKILLEDHALRARLAENARTMVNERFRWLKVIPQLEAVLLDVMRG